MMLLYVLGVRDELVVDRQRYGQRFHQRHNRSSRFVQRQTSHRLLVDCAFLPCHIDDGGK